MRVNSWQFTRLSVMGAVVLSACAGVPPSVSPEPAGKHYSSVDEAVRDLAAAAAAAAAEPTRSVPTVRVFVPSNYTTPTRYVDASLRVSDNAYVMVIAVDLDRRVRVVYPESPSDAGYVMESTPQRLEKFFMGFGTGSRGPYSFSSNPVQPISRYYGDGLLIALASDRPLQFERMLDSDGNWDESALERLIFQSSVSSAEHRLGTALVLSGQEFSSDYTTFGGRNEFGRFNAYALGSYGGLGCGDYSDSYTGFISGLDYSRVSQAYAFDGPNGALVRYSQVGNIRYVSYLIEGSCGRNYYSPWVELGPISTPPVRADTARKPDSTTPAAYRARIADVIADGSTATGRSARPIDGVTAGSSGAAAGADAVVGAGSGRQVGGFRVRPTSPTGGNGDGERTADGPTRPSIRIRPPDQVAERGARAIDAADHSAGTERSPQEQQRGREQAERSQQTRERVQQQQQQQQQKQQLQQQQQQQAEGAQQTARPAQADRPRPVIEPVPY